MASNTKNVKLGVCQVIYDGVDLGYTQGGVEVTVKSDTHKVNVDQFGKTTINEYIMGRDVTAKAPLAETTIDNMVAIMPGATMTVVGGTVASGSITVTTNPTTGDTIVVNGQTFTFKTAAALPTEVGIGAAAANTAANLAAVLNASTIPAVAGASYSAAGAVVTIKYGNQLIYGFTGNPSADGNNFTLAAGTAGAKVTIVGMTGGSDATSRSVVVTHGVGIDLLSIAKELRLHPTNKAAGDVSEDFVLPLAATSGSLNFAYKVENERIYDVEFTGYPDPATGKLFTVGV